MDEQLTLKQRIVLWVFTFISLSSIFIIGIMLDALVYCFLLFVAFSIVNVVLIRIGKKEHAPTVRVSKTIEIDSIFMCYLVSNFMFFMCMVIMQYSENLMNSIQAGILGIVLIAFASIVLSGIFYFKPKGESKYKILIEYIKYMGISDEFLEAETALKKRVSPQEYRIFKRILIDGNDWESTIEEFDVHRQQIKEALDNCYFFMIGRLNQ